MSAHSHRVSHAPETSQRPVARPANLNTGGLNVTPHQEPARRTPGMFDGMGMVDETDKFGKLSRGARGREPDSVVLHQTMSRTGDSTRGAYERRIEDGGHTGAHYLIDEEGELSLTVPTDERVDHTVGRNMGGIGVETVGYPEQVDQRGEMHAQIEAMDLSPKLKERLLALSEPALKREMARNGNYIYQDITGPQKRANWNLLRALAEQYGIDMTADVVAHEDVQAKTIGEGENTEEFVDAMREWPRKIEALRERIAALEAEPGTNPSQIAELGELLRDEEAKYQAVESDGTVQEENALEGEALLGEVGPATRREAVRTEFWEEFYPGMERLNNTLMSLG